MHNFYVKGLPVLIATMHSKEKVIGPLIQQKLGLHWKVPEKFDTDQFGSFSGEIPRALSPLETLRKKCLAGMQMDQSKLGIASEGSFGTHPENPFILGGYESLIWIDSIHQVEIIESGFYSETNYSYDTIHTETELFSFCKQIGFPLHAVLLSDPEQKEICIKGINNHTTLRESFQAIVGKYNRALIQTDMRAHFNPIRMKTIQHLTLQLITRLLRLCPSCGIYGFGTRSSQPGLPCAQCRMPTKSPLVSLCTCLQCGYVEHKMYPINKTAEDPMYCNFCNP